MRSSRLAPTRRATHTATRLGVACLTGILLTGLVGNTPGIAIPASAHPLASLTHEAPASHAHAAGNVQLPLAREGHATPLSLAPAQPTAPVQRPELLGETPTSSGLDVRLTDLEPRIITGDSDVTVTGTIRNLSSTPSVNPSLDFYVQTWTPITAEDLHRYLTGEAHEGRRIHSATVEGTLAPGASTTFRTTIPRAALPFTDSFEWGPRGITVHADDDHSSGKDRSILIWDSGYALSPTQVNVLLPWTSTTPHTPADSSSILAMAGMQGVTFAVDTPTLTGLYTDSSASPLTIGNSSATSLPWSLATPSSRAAGEAQAASTRGSDTSSASEAAGGSTGGGNSDSTSAGAAGTESGSAPAGATASSSGSAPTPSTSTSTASLAPTTAPTQTPEEIAALDSFFRDFFSRTRELVALPDYDADLGLLATFSQPELAERALASRTTVPTSLRQVRNASSLRSSTEASAPSSASASTSATQGASTSSSPASSDTQARSADGSAAGDTSSPSSPTPTPTGEGHPGAESTTGADVSPSSVPQPSPTADTSASSDPNAPTLISNVVWPSRESYGRSFLARSAGQVVIAPSGAHATTGDLNFTSMAAVRINRETGEVITQEEQWSEPQALTALTSIDTLTQLASWTTSSSDDELDTQQALRAMTAIITRERPNLSRTLFVPLERGVSLDSTRQGRVDALVSPRWVQGISFDSVVNSEPTDVAREAAGQSAPSQADIDAVNVLDGSFSSALRVAHATNAVETSTRTLTSSVFNALRTGLSAEERAQTTASAREWLDAFRSAVKVESSQAVNVINKSVAFPVRVRNDLPWPVTVSVSLLPSDPRLQVTQRPEATIPAHSTSTVDVPVSAIGSGDIYVTYRLSTSTGELVDGSQRVLVRMRAGWEDAITAVFAALFALAFTAGIIRTIRRRLRAKTSGEASSPLPGLGGAPRGTVNVPLSNGEHVQAGRPRPVLPLPEEPEASGTSPATPHTSTADDAATAESPSLDHETPESHSDTQETPRNTAPDELDPALPEDPRGKE